MLAALFIALVSLPIVGWAVGLGDILVNSSLNQPLDASIPIVDIGAMPIQSVTAKLAPPDQFTAVGLIRDPNLSALQFNVQLDKQQQPIVSVTSVQPISQPVLTFLLQLSWSGGQLMREYTVFLDPTNYAAPAKPKPQAVAVPKPQAAQPASAGSNKAAATYGPTVPQDNLWEIAQDHRADASITVPQNMLAILNLNPRAFTNNNINGLKSGYILKLPTQQQALAIAPDDAQAQLNQQNIAWQNRTGTTVLPTATNTADTTTSTATDTSAPTETLSPADNDNASAPDSGSDLSDLSSASTAEQPEVLQSNNALANDNTATSDKTVSIQTLQNELAMATQAMQATEQANQVLQQNVKDLQQQVTTLQTELAAKNREISILEKLVADADEQQHPAAIPVATPTQSATLANTPAPAGHRLLYIALLLCILIAASIAAGILLPWRQFLTQLTAIKFARRHADQTKEAKIEEPVAASVNPAPVTPVLPPVMVEKTVAKEEPVAVVTESIVATAVETPSAQTISVLDEADVYIAYGRYQKAESLLLSSLKQTPKQPAILMKLLEVYTAEGQREKFDDIAKQLPAVTELPVTLQTSLDKLLDRWNKYQAAPVADVADDVINAAEENSIVASETVVTETKSDNNVIEFDGDWGTPTTTATSVEPEPTPAVNAAEIDIEHLSLAVEENETVTEPVQTIPSKPQPKATNLQTRLDLAKAYYDMGDFVEALGILQEILVAGSEEQKQTAQTLIDEINRK